MQNFSVEQSLMKAKSYANKGETIEAQKLYETILKNFSNNLRAQQGLAALKKYNVNKNTQSPPQEVINQLINLYNQGQFSVVAEQAEVLTKQYPTAILIWNILGAVRSQIGMFDEAIEAYKTTISLKPDFAEAYNNMGIVLKDQGKFAESIDAHKKSIACKPDYAEAYYNIGIAYRHGNGVKRDMKKAYHYYELAAMGGNTDARHNLGYGELQKGNWDRALKHFMIAARSGYDASLKKVGEGYKAGHVSKDDYIKTLRSSVFR